MATPASRIDFAINRRPALAALAALAVGVLVGPLGLHLVRPQLLEDGPLVESSTEVALLVSLFCLGLRLRMPIEWTIWRVPLRLATVTMLATVALAAAAAHLVFDMNLAGSLLLGAIIVPTDAILASDVLPQFDGDQDAPSFVLAAESGVNNGLATVLILLVLGMMGLGDSDSAALSSVSMLALWSALGGLTVGWLIGAGMARWITMVDPERQAEFLEEAMVFATAALAYGAALAMRTNGFLAVLSAGVALSHGGRLSRPIRNRPLMPRLQKIAARIERYAWLAIIVLLGTLIASIDLKPAMLVFAAALLLVIRPIAVRLGLGSISLPDTQWRVISWFSPRGVACLYCLTLTLNHGLATPFARELTGTTLVVLVTSILTSALSSFPLSRHSPDAFDL